MSQEKDPKLVCPNGHEVWWSFPREGDSCPDCGALVMRREFQFPRLHITRTVEEDGELYSEAVTSPVCDMCFDTRVAWDYTTDKFVIEGTDFASDEGWLLCDECAKLVEARFTGDLIVRVIRSWLSLGQPVGPESVDHAGKIVHAFFDHLHPGREAFG